MGGKDEKRKPDDPEQSKRFAETAKRLGVDESGKIFEKAMDQIASNAADTKGLAPDKKDS